MRLISIKEPFSIKPGESIEIADYNLNVLLKNLSRIMVPKRGDQFIMVLDLEWKDAKEEVGIDGAFNFTADFVGKDWQIFRIQIHDIDIMAKNAMLAINTINNAI